MAKTVIDIAIACSKSQTPKWWTALLLEVILNIRRNDIEIGQIFTAGTALFDYNKNKFVKDFLGRTGERNIPATDEQRNMDTEDFMNGRADWLYWIDDDTIHPPGTISRLMNIGKPFVSGLYLHKVFPFPPIAYMKTDIGEYEPVKEFDKGEIVEVDSVGMGCALIHRSVYEKVRAYHDVYLRGNHELFALPKTSVRNLNNLNGKIKRAAGYIVDGIYCMPVAKVEDDSPVWEKRQWPYYAMNYGRTEDHYFCELAAEAGIKPYLDTNVFCKHTEHYDVGEAQWRDIKKKTIRMKLAEQQEEIGDAHIGRG